MRASFRGSERPSTPLRLAAKTSRSTSTMPFSISVTGGWNGRLRVEQDAYYAMRSSFVPLWTVYLPNPNACIDEIRDPDIPTPFSRRHRGRYEEFFRRYGSHYVRGAWVGGKSTLIFTVRPGAAGDPGAAAARRADAESRGRWLRSDRRGVPGQAPRVAERRTAALSANG